MNKEYIEIIKGDSKSAIAISDDKITYYNDAQNVKELLECENKKDVIEDKINDLENKETHLKKDIKGRKISLSILMVGLAALIVMTTAIKPTFYLFDTSVFNFVPLAIGVMIGGIVHYEMIPIQRRTKKRLKKCVSDKYRLEYELEKVNKMQEELKNNVQIEKEETYSIDENKISSMIVELEALKKNLNNSEQENIIVKKLKL